MLKIRSLFLVLFGSCLISIAFAAPKNRDWAIFKIADDVQFSSDLLPLYQDLWTFHCAYEDAVLLKIQKLEFSKTEKESMEMVGKDDSSPFTPERKKVWGELKKLLKLLSYVNQSKVVMKESLPKDVLNLAKAANCKTRGKETLKNFEKLLRMEVFLKSRFNNRFYIDQKEPHKEDKKSNERLEEAMETFFKTIDRQIMAEDFF